MPTRFLTLLLLVSFAAIAQTDTSALGGRVTDPQGDAVSGAQLRLTNQATHAERNIASGSSGAYLFPLIPAGHYDIEVKAPGFKTFHDSGLQIDVAAPAHLDIPLEIGAVSDSVEVEGVVSLLNTESAAQGTVIGEEKIQSLPLNGRQFIDLALLSPNVTIGGESVQQNKVRLNQDGGFSASGNRTNNNAYMLDGISDLDLDYMSLSLTPDSGYAGGISGADWAAERRIRFRGWRAGERGDQIRRQRMAWRRVGVRPQPRFRFATVQSGFLGFAKVSAEPVRRHGTAARFDENKDVSFSVDMKG